MENKNAMFCFQCQETMAGTGCTRVGMCGKKPDLAAMQDLLIYATKGISAVTTQLRREKQEVAPEVNRLITQNLCMTITNANFDVDAIRKAIEKTVRVKDELLPKVKKNENLPDAAHWSGTPDSYEGKAASNEVGVLSARDDDIRSFRELITYGVKGIASFNSRANALGAEDADVDAFIQRALSQMLDETMTGGNLLALVMETGRYGVRVMDLIDRADAERFGKPEAGKVQTGVRTNPAILVAGDDYHDLDMLLEQLVARNSRVDVYTYSEMEAAGFYPKLKAYPNYAGNYGGAWWNQKTDFEKFHGPVLMTGGGIVPPKPDVAARMYTTGAAGYPGTVHIEEDEAGRKDFSALIEAAEQCEAPEAVGSGSLAGGYGHYQMGDLIDRLAENIQNGSISKIFVLSGSDGRAKTRSYYEDLVKMVPEDAVIMTAGTNKFRFMKTDDQAEVAGIPKVMDAGGIADVYSIIQTLLALKDKMGVDNLNQLPVVWDIAWHDQRDITVLLSLLYLDVKHIHIGPTFPAFLSRNVKDVIVKYFGLTQIRTVQEDMESFLGKSDALIQPDMIVGDIVQTYPSLVPVMMECGLHCIGCGVSTMETLEEACMTHGLDVYDILDVLNDELSKEGKTSK
ncbi:MAG: hydroxylamine reductase [Eubacteriales bacterium]|jgi:hydroxylamine reductase